MMFRPQAPVLAPADTPAPAPAYIPPHALANVTTKPPAPIQLNKKEEKVIAILNEKFH